MTRQSREVKLAPVIVVKISQSVIAIIIQIKFETISAVRDALDV